MSEQVDPEYVEENDDEEEEKEEEEEKDNGEEEDGNDEEYHQAVLEALSDINDELVRIRRATEASAGGNEFVKAQEKERSKPKPKPVPKKAAKKKGR